jgi:hypothetical protein
MHSYDSTGKLWLWNNGSWRITKKPGTPMLVQDPLSDPPPDPLPVDPLGGWQPTGLLFNEKNYYKSNDGTQYLWSNGSSWIISSALGWRVEEWSEDTVSTVIDTESTPNVTTETTITAWLGDEWWIGPDSSGDPTGTYTKRGLDKIGVRTVVKVNGSKTSDTTADSTRKNKVVKAGTPDGWKWADDQPDGAYAPYGFYEPVENSTLTGRKFAGWLKYRLEKRSTTPYAVKTTTVRTKKDDGTYEADVVAYELSYTIVTLNSTVTTEGNVTTIVEYSVVGNYGASWTNQEALFLQTTQELRSYPVFYCSKFSVYLWYGADEKWIISPEAGTADDSEGAAGYWEAAEKDSIESTYTRKWTAPSPQTTPETWDADKNDYVIELLGISTGETSTVWATQQPTVLESMPIGQVALWL